MDRLDTLKLNMIAYEAGCAERAQHFLKVHSLASIIGKCEKLDERTQFLLESAALVHDIGIKPALEKHKRSDGPYQEREGIAPAREMLTRLGYEEGMIERICFLVGHHHTYSAIDGIDFQILVEADFLVNIFEHGDSKETALNVREKIFKTESGKKIITEMFGL